MSFRRTFRPNDLIRLGTTVMLTLLMMAGGPGFPVSARESSSDSAPRVTAFAGIPWDAGREQILEVYGPPDDSFLMQRRLSRFPNPGWRGIVMEYWDRRAYGQNANIRFFYDSTEGLRKGEFRFRFEVDDDCRKRFLDLKHTVRERFPDIQAVRRKHVPEIYSNLCRGAIIGAARWDVWWKDPGSPALVHLSIGRNQRYIVLAFEGPRWVWWRGSMDDVFLEPYETADPDPEHER